MRRVDRRDDADLGVDVDDRHDLARRGRPVRVGMVESPAEVVTDFAEGVGPVLDLEPSGVD